MALERYAAHRFGEDIPASTIRDYCGKHGISSKVAHRFNGVEPDEAVDIIGARADLIGLQIARIQLDWKREQDRGKLLKGTSTEISTLNRILTQHRMDLQAVGLMPVAGQKIELSGVPTEAEVGAPKHRSLGEALGGDAGEDDATLGKLIHLALRQQGA